MDDISLIIESLTPEQYKKLFKDLPIPSITINHNRDKYIEELSNNIYQKKILNTMINNNFNISSVSDNSISILVDLNNGKIIKYLKEHLDKTNIDINIKGLNSNVLGVNIKFSNENEVSIKDIYTNDSVFNKIPFDKLTQEQKYTMCNKYFRQVIKERIYDLNYKLKQIYGVDYKTNFFNQFEQNLGNYGITGNTPPFEENKIYEIMINMYPNVDYCSFNGDKAILNTDLLGQIMITLLHEHEHILQRIGMVDENIKNAITNFKSIYPDGSDGYFENYANDPAEIDANLVSFNRFIELSKFCNIDNPDVIIMKKINNVINKAEDQMNLYDNNSFSNYAETQEYLYQKLQNSMDTYNNVENIHKSF